MIYNVWFGNKQYSYSMQEYDDILLGSTMVNAQVCTITAISIRPGVQVKCLGFELELRQIL